MVLKQTLQNLSDTNIADESNIEAAEHREVNDSMIDAMFSAPVFFNSADPDTDLMTPNHPNMPYTMLINKVGSQVFIEGKVRNTNTTALNGQSFIVFNNNTANPIFPLDTIDDIDGNPFTWRTIGRTLGGVEILIELRRLAFTGQTVMIVSGNMPTTQTSGLNQFYHFSINYPAKY